jgi:putative glutamine amidotransferase
MTAQTGPAEEVGPAPATGAVPSARAAIVGMTCRVLSSRGLPPRYGQNQAYVQALVRAGAVPLLIPPIEDTDRLRRLYGVCDGLLLPGGEDVEPARYGEAPHPGLRETSAPLDEVELTLARWAVRDGVPLLGICRGIQVLNVAMGGTLYQDLGLRRRRAEKHDWFPGYPRDRLSHAVEVRAGTRLAEIVGEGVQQVNSLHHQAIKKLAPGLRVAARAPDGVVEAVEVEGYRFACAVQWHPEELAGQDRRAQRLFDALVEACAG